jgi:signal peptidase II
MTLKAAALRWTVLAAAVVGTDLGTKQLAVRELGEPVGLVPGLDLQLGYNSGVAFGMLTNLPAWLLVAGVALLIGGLIVSVWRGLLSPPWPAVGLLLGGAVANLIDRAADGRVTDFIDPSWWPAFNLADVAITVAVALLLVTGLRDERDSGTSSAPA